MSAFGRHTFQMSDEFYLDAGIDPPEADFYDGYPQYYDGIGMIRSYLDETDDVLAAYTERLARVREAIAARSQHLLCLSGASARDTVAALWSRPGTSPALSRPSRTATLAATWT